MELNTGPGFAPYFDVTLDRPNLYEYMQLTGQKDFTLAFALGGSQGDEYFITLTFLI